MKLTNEEHEFIIWYRTLTAEAKKAVETYITQGDSSQLAALGKQSECFNRISRIAITQRSNKSQLRRI